MGVGRDILGEHRPGRLLSYSVSRSCLSDVLFSIPSFTTVLVAICDDTVNETSTSLVLDIALIISPSVNVPTTLCNSNSVTAN